MSARIFSLTDVPAEEAEGVRNALGEAGIEFYETPGGMELGDPAIWVAEDGDAPVARAAIDRYQSEWRARSRSVQPQSRAAQPQSPKSPIQPESPLGLPFRIGVFVLLLIAFVIWLLR